MSNNKVTASPPATAPTRPPATPPTTAPTTLPVEPNCLYVQAARYLPGFAVLGIISVNMYFDLVGGLCGCVALVIFLMFFKLLFDTTISGYRSFDIANSRKPGDCHRFGLAFNARRGFSDTTTSAEDMRHTMDINLFVLCFTMAYFGMLTALPSLFKHLLRRHGVRGQSTTHITTDFLNRTNVAYIVVGLAMLLANFGYAYKLHEKCGNVFTIVVTMAAAVVAGFGSAVAATQLDTLLYHHPTTTSTNTSRTEIIDGKQYTYRPLDEKTIRDITTLIEDNYQ